MGKFPLLALPIQANWKLVGAEQMGALARWGGCRDAPGLGCKDSLAQLSTICGRERFPPSQGREEAMYVLNRLVRGEMENPSFFSLWL